MQERIYDYCRCYQSGKLLLPRTEEDFQFLACADFWRNLDQFPHADNMVHKKYALSVAACTLKIFRTGLCEKIEQDIAFQPKTAVLVRYFERDTTFVGFTYTQLRY